MAQYTDTKKGQNLYLSFEQLRTAYTTNLPGHTQQLRTLATRPISG